MKDQTDEISCFRTYVPLFILGATPVFVDIDPITFNIEPAKLALAIQAVNEPVVFPAHPRTSKFLQEAGYRPPENVKLIDPVGCFDIIALEKSAWLLLQTQGACRRRPIV